MSQESNQNQPDAGVAALTPEMEEILTGLESIVIQLERLMESRSREALQQPGKDGSWGVVEVLCHLRDWEDVIHDRIWQIVEGERPEFDDPDATMWPLEHDYRAQDAHEVFEALAAKRRSLVERLREVDEAAWTRMGVMSGQGEITLGELLDHVIEHDRTYFEEAREAVA